MLQRNQRITPSGQVLEDEWLPRGLYASRSTITADGTTELTFGWSGDAATAPSEVTFTVNGTEHTVPVQTHQDHAEFAGAEDTLTASETMTITIEAQGESIDIEATDPNA